MTGIGKCRGKNCESREFCFRFTCSIEKDWYRQGWRRSKKPAPTDTRYCEDFVWNMKIDPNRETDE